MWCMRQRQWLNHMLILYQIFHECWRTKLAWKLLFHGKSLNEFSSQKRRWKNALWSGEMRTERLHELPGGGCRNEYQKLVGTLVKYFHRLYGWPFLHVAKVPRLYQQQPFQIWNYSLSKAVLKSAVCAHYVFFRFAPALQQFIML